MSLVPPYIENLAAYEPGRNADDVRRQYGLGCVAKLASNENPLGSSPLAVEAIRNSLSKIHRYPNCGLDLRRALAQKFGVKVDNVVVGNGSDGIIGDIIRTFLADRDEVLTTEAAFGSFQVTARSRGVPYKTVPYRNWHYDLEALAKAVNDRTKVIYLANPNNPTGTYFTQQEFEEFYRHVPPRVLIILDEAYFEYAREEQDYPDSLQYRFDNVITLRTFSKAYGLAGLRVGYGLAHEDLIRNLLKVRRTFEPNLLGEVAAIAALQDTEFLKKSVELNSRERLSLAAQLIARGFWVVPSAANFLMIAMENAAAARSLTQGLLERGVIIRNLSGFGLPQCVRISIGSPENHRFCLAQMDALRLDILGHDSRNPAGWNVAV